MANNTLVASDSFASGSLAAGWSAYPGMSVCQVVNVPPFCAEPNAINTSAGQIWTGTAFPSDQCSEITVNINTVDVYALSVRTSAGPNGYVAAFTASGLTIYRSDAGVLTSLKNVAAGVTIAAGDILTFQAAGCCLSVYQNYSRIAYFYDLTYTSGSPGFYLNGTAVAHCQVSAWRGYSAIQQDGIWQKQGIVMPPVSRDLTQAQAGSGIQCWNIFLDGNAQILSGNVYKTWIVSDWTNDAASAMFYAESSDGITWSRRGAAVLNSVTNGSVFKSGSTYYLYGQASGASGSGTMAVYTSSDGITWNVQAPSQTIGVGGVGAWDHNSFYNIISVAIVAGTWYGFYNGAAGGPFSTGLATSTDGINWTKFGGNGGPVISNVLTGSALFQVGSTWYMWGLANAKGLGGTTLDPFEMVRYSSPDLQTWTLSSHSVHRGQMFESVNALTGGVNPAAIANVGSRTYLWLNSSQADATAPQVGQLSLAIASLPIASIVGLREDATLQANTDNFSGTLSNWTTPSGVSALQIVSGSLEASALSTLCGECYTGGATPSNDQYSEFTIQVLSTTDFMQPAVRMKTASKTYYTVGVKGPTNTSVAGQFSKVVSGTTTTIGPTFNFTPQVGDVMRLSVVGNVLSLYQNAFLVFQVQDAANSITSGNPGMVFFVASNLANAKTNLWAGGSAFVSVGGTSKNLLLLGVG